MCQLLLIILVFINLQITIMASEGTPKNGENAQEKKEIQKSTCVKDKWGKCNGRFGVFFLILKILFERIHVRQNTLQIGK